jgi:S-(hydroxymethyl)glutathione dehydrogenase/alcohol dehydrogenase
VGGTGDGRNEGRLELDRLVSARISLDEVNDGYAELRAGTTVRSVITFD